MLEPWDEVLTQEKERQSCAEDVTAIQVACVADHGKLHVAECTECWPRLLNRMRDRYLNSATKEWFSGRRLFLQDLDTLFTQAHEYKTDLKTIEQRISDEKREWFRDKAKNLGFQSAAKSPAEAKALQQKLNDRSIPVEELVPEFRNALGEDASGNQNTLNDLLDRLKTAKSPQSRAEAYVDIFFQPGRETAGAAKSQKYIDMVRNGTPIADVIHVMLRDRQASKGNQEQKEALQKKLEELRRAKAAHEVDKAKKAKLKQEVLSAAAVDDVSEVCLACSQTIPGDYSSCSLCDVLTETYSIRKESTLFCPAEECSVKGLEAHWAKAHLCAAGDHCIDLQKEDVDMDGDNRITVLCRECVEAFKVESVFCSPQCYSDNFQRHREGVHLSEWAKIGEIADDDDDLEYLPGDESKYRARKIEKHFVVFDDVLADLEKKTSAP
ncbi:uncharacterized protein PG998_012595 [Apiospora kogelbergensis]|uniref:C2H2-type domain-containing protein n=1 Tax=Apiospora kogelbergensis TaxID=1337665 RepID=A0AAW0QUR2_9PEZI